MERLKSILSSLDKEKKTPETKATINLIRSQKYNGMIGDKQTYWTNPVFASPAAFLGFDIPVIEDIALKSGFHRASSNNNVLVYEEASSALVISEIPVEIPAEIPVTRVPSFVIHCQQVIGKSVQTTSVNLRDLLSNADWKEVISKVAASIAPKSYRNVATQTIETRLTVVPQPGCLKCKKTSHMTRKCPNPLTGDPYCTNCRRLGHTNNSCPYQPASATGYHCVKGYCYNCSAQYPFYNDQCEKCLERVEMTRASRGAYRILPP
ncbi:uncharacterized protein LOC123261108 [Cotesia glomerata]|uniref:uncharacterized protein LOC123261108 n=1 Tax=Cotesia glomerata TaxID=32391 RepID=UPI001D01D9D3|nr:uncharacterized protein LOC123261108 [Cotesia glomerata]